MVIDPKGGGLLSIKEACKRGILCVTGAPVVTGHHENNEAIEAATITSRRSRHLNNQFDEVNEKGDTFFESSFIKQRGHRTKSSAESARAKKKTPIVYDNEFLNSDYIRENPGVLTNAKVKTTIKTTTEEHRKKISGQDVIEKVKADFKETVLVPGEKPHVQSTALYDREFKTKLDLDGKKPVEAFLDLTSEAFHNNTSQFNSDVQKGSGHKIEIKTSLNGIGDKGKK